MDRTGVVTDRHDAGAVGHANGQCRRLATETHGGAMTDLLRCLGRASVGLWAPIAVIDRGDGVQ